MSARHGTLRAVSQWDKVENKTSVVLYGAGAVLLVWFSSTLVTALNSIPLLPKLMELVGLGYTSWFIYRYLLFKARPSVTVAVAVAAFVAAMCARMTCKAAV